MVPAKPLSASQSSTVTCHGSKNAAWGRDLTKQK
jgi:hypothetical protein